MNQHITLKRKQFFPDPRPAKKVNAKISLRIDPNHLGGLHPDLQGFLGVRCFSIIDRVITTEVAELLCNALHKAGNDTLEEAEFLRCHFEAPALIRLITTLKSSSLAKLSLTQSKLRDNQVEVIFELIRTSKSLKELDLSGNEIRFDGEWVVEPLASSLNLVELILKNNRIGPAGEAYLAEALRRNKSIKCLCLDSNPLGGDKIANALKENSTLVVLKLREALQDIPLAIAKALKVNKSLKALILNESKFKSERVFVELIRALKENSSLIFLGLYDTNLSNEHIRKIRHYFAELRDLRNLSPEEKQIIANCTPPYLLGGQDDYLPLFSQEAVFDTNEEWNFLEEKPYKLPVIKDHRLNAHLTEAQKEMYNALYSSFGGFESRYNRIAEENQLRLNINSIKKKIRELQQQLQTLQSQLPDKEDLVEDELQALRAHLKYPIAKATLQELEEDLKKKEQRMNGFKEKIKSEPIEEWSVSDVLVFMKDINASVSAIEGIEQNGITGKMLLGLTTEDIIDYLKMPFNDAKRLQTYILLVKNKTSIFGPFESTVLNWTNKQVLDWLEENDLTELVTQFKAKEITGQELFTIDSRDLGSVELRIKTLGVKIAFEEAIKKLRHEEDPLNEFPKISAVKKTCKREMKKNPPIALRCPLTKQLMADPVQLSDGHTYERSAIEKWLVDHNTSPVTHESLTSKQYFPSFAIKAMINEFNDNNL